MSSPQWRVYNTSKPNSEGEVIEYAYEKDEYNLIWKAAFRKRLLDQNKAVIFEKIVYLEVHPDKDPPNYVQFNKDSQHRPSNIHLWGQFLVENDAVPEEKEGYIQVYKAEQYILLAHPNSVRKILAVIPH